MRISAVVELVAVLALGLAAGAMLTEGAILVPYWRALPAPEFLAWYAANGSRLLAFFGPLEIAAAIAAALAAGLGAYQSRPGRRLLVLSALCAVAVLAAFPLYFRDVNAAFAAGTIDLDRVPPELARWSAWHWVRTLVGALGFAAAVLGIAARRQCPD